jgi:hypothetical protein
MNWYGIWTLKVLGLATQIKCERAAGFVPRKEVLADGKFTRSGARHLQSAAD